MPFAASCPHCRKQYQLPEQLAGKTVKCKECRQDFVAGPAATASGTPAAASSPAGRPGSLVSAGTAGGTSELSRFGLDGPIVRPSTDIFADAPQPPRSGDPLGNFANEDPGFAGSAIHGKPSKKASQPVLAPPAKSAPLTSTSKIPFDNPYASAAANLRKTAKPKTADIQREFDRLDMVAKQHNTMMLAFLGGVGTRLLFTLILVGIQFFTGFYIRRDKPNFGLPDHLLYTMAGIEIVSSIISIVTAIMLLVAIYKLAANLYPGTKSKFLHLILFFIPLGVLFSLLSLDRAARTQLRAAGYTVGMLGVNSTP